ncbi:MAG TPA: hypothetical protein VFS26_08145 [Solirubrobacterales bacterium]|nr:hypothetical protein [Solirubrobacterales bacterium]
MKHLKMLGLVAVAAVALTAAGAGGTASATVLCKTTLTTGCAAAGWDYAKGTAVHIALEVGQHATLNAFWTDVTCRKTTIELKLANTGGASETVIGNIESLTPEECSCAGGPVGTAHATTISTGSGEIHYISGTHDGTLTGSGTVITLNCTNLGTQCRFGTGSGIHIGTLTSGDPATADGVATLVSSSGTGDEGIFICGSSATWEAKYEVTAPKPLYIAAS